MIRQLQIGIFFTALLVIALSSPFVGLFNQAVQWGPLPKSLWILLLIWLFATLLSIHFSRKDDLES